jgi:hypothetical protein
MDMDVLPEASLPVHETLNFEQVGQGSDLEKRLDADAAARKASRKPQLLRWLLMGFVMLFLVGVLLDYAELLPTGSKDSASDTSSAESPVTPNTAVKKDASAPQGQLDVLWSELVALRTSRDLQGAPFRISSVLLSPDRPVITGAVSPLIETDKIHIVVYPDLSRTLMDRPRVWWFDENLADGFFSVGPLSLEGRPLPAGTYRVMAQSLGKYLGTVSFEVGHFPSGPELEVQMKALQNERAMASGEEFKQLETRFRDLDALYESLRSDVVRYAIRGASSRSVWRKSMHAWTSAFTKTYQAFSNQNALTYYPDLRARLETFSKELLKTQGLMDLYSEKGRAVFERRAGRRYTELWSSLQKDRDALKSEFLLQANQTQTEASLNEEMIKARLLERK